MYVERLEIYAKLPILFVQWLITLLLLVVMNTVVYHVFIQVYKLTFMSGCTMWLTTISLVIYMQVTMAGYMLNKKKKSQSWIYIQVQYCIAERKGHMHTTLKSPNPTTCTEYNQLSRGQAHTHVSPNIWVSGSLTPRCNFTEVVGKRTDCGTWGSYTTKNNVHENYSPFFL